MGNEKTTNHILQATCDKKHLILNIILTWEMSQLLTPILRVELDILETTQ